MPPAQYAPQVAAGATMATLTDEQVAARMSPLTMPVLILFSEHDKVVPPGNAQLMADKLPNAQLIEKFYSSFQKKEAAGMIACYHPDVEFSDAVFALRGKQVGAMWRMFCEGGRDLAVTLGDIQADDARGQAHWEATYTFSATGRRVHNVIEAEFQFKDGKIIRHHDHFDFWRWARMALGLPGLLLGWTPMVRNQVKRIGRGNLEKFIQAHPQYQ